MHRPVKPTFSSIKLFAFVFVIAVALLMASPGLWTTQSAGNMRSGKVGAPQDSDGPKSRRILNLDVRVNGQGKLSQLARVGSPAIVKQAQTQSLALQKGLSSLKATVPGAEAKLSRLTGAVEVVRSSGALTGPAQGRSGQDIVRDFISGNRELYGLAASDIANLNFLGESVNRVSGLRMVRVEQVVNGLPVFQSETRFIVDRDGRVFRSTGLMIPGASAVAPPLDQLQSAQEALRASVASLGITVDAAQMTLSEINPEGTKGEVISNDPQIAGNVPSKLVYFPLAPGVLIPAWSQIIFMSEGDADWYTLVDATTGELLWRKNIRNTVSTHDARFRVYVQADGKTPADSPAPQSPTAAVTGGGTQFPEILPTIVSMLTVQDIVASQNGWIDDCPGGVCTTAETTTTGNNVDAYLDRVAPFNSPDTGALDNNGRPIGNPDTNTRNRDFLGLAPRDFESGYLPPPQGGNPEAGQTATGVSSPALDSFRRGAVTHLFYVTNWYHDQLFALGFDEAAGNFQQINFSGMGVGGDRVLAEAQDGGSTNNANFSTPPDGSSGRMQMYRFTFPIIDRDGGLDAEIVIHELTHGTSNRLVGNAAGLNWDIGGGMGEGWSDFYALSLLNNTNADNPNGKYASGAYATYKLGGLLDNYVYGIRRFPYSTDNSINPLTWADVDDTTANMSGGIAPSPLGFEFNGALEVHNSGEIWANSLWEVRSRVIADPLGANGDVPTGNNTMLSIVTDGLKMTPINPSFEEGRDALIDADCAANACANEQSIWDGFADRGLGYKAIAPLGYMFGYRAGHIGLAESFLAPYLDVQSVTIDDSLGNNNGAIDPGESIKIIVKLKNPWRNAAKGVASATATLTSSTAGVVIQDGNSTYPAIPAQGNADGDTFRFEVPTTVTCGQSLKFTITPTSTLGSQPVEFVLRVGAAAGTLPAIAYTKDTTPDLAIPDNAPVGVIDTLTITDDYEIADLDFRVDSVTHTFTGDLSLLLKAPNGYGTDFVSLIGGIIDGGPGDNIVNMVIDDDVPNIAANDMVQASSAAAPYTKSWVPVFNGPWGPLAGFGPTDPVGELSRLNGTSTEGTWKVLASDQFGADTGTLNAWSIIVTPVAFTCTAFTPAADLAVSKTDAPDPVVAGSNITYTINFINNGPNTASTVTVTDAVPANTTFVSATTPLGWTRTDSVPSGGTGNIVFAKASVASGETAVFTIVVNVNAGTPAATIISNDAVAASSTFDPNTANNTGNATTTVVAAPAQKLVWTSERDGNEEIYIMNIDGTGKLRLTNHSKSDSDPDLSTDGSKVVFESARTGTKDIYVVNANGTGLTRLTTHSKADTDPVWSSDGSKITFVSERDGNQEIYVMNADGTSQTRLTNHSKRDYDPRFSPDGSKIVFVSERNGRGDIYVVDVTGANLTRLTTNSKEDNDPAWAPDGSKIVFVSERDGNEEIYVMNANGSSQTRLTNQSKEDNDPSFAPDGTKILFVSERNGNEEIYVMNPNGTSPTRLTNNSKEDEDPIWSPDSAKIVFVSERTGNCEIFVMDANGSSQTNISNHSRDDEDPSF